MGLVIRFIHAEPHMEGKLEDLTDDGLGFDSMNPCCESSYQLYGCTLPPDHPKTMPHMAGTSQIIAAIWWDHEADKWD